MWLKWATGKRVWLKWVWLKWAPCNSVCLVACLHFNVPNVLETVKAVLSILLHSLVIVNLKVDRQNIFYTSLFII